MRPSSKVGMNVNRKRHHSKRLLPDVQANRLPKPALPFRLCRAVREFSPIHIFLRAPNEPGARVSSNSSLVSWMCPSSVALINRSPSSKIAKSSFTRGAFSDSSHSRSAPFTTPQSNSCTRVILGHHDFPVGQPLAQSRLKLKRLSANHICSSSSLIFCTSPLRKNAFKYTPVGSTS